MPERIWRPERIYVDAAVKDHARVRDILSRCPDIPTEPLDDVKTFLESERTKRSSAFTEGKQALMLTRHRGKFLSMCPALTETAVCCNYRTINLIMGCNFDCSYCFLQAYLKNPFTTFFVNLEDMFGELASVLTQSPNRAIRFGTGEFTDSLSLDRVIGINKELVTFFGHHTHATLELKTKSAQVDALLDLPHNGRTIIAWSVNTAFIQRTEEHKTATLEERFKAAQKCAERGYRVAFHFDPLIIHEGWQEGYRETVNLMRSYIPQEAIAWISYGSLRFVPDLKHEAQSRFPGTPIYSNEFIKGFDGKMRYFTPLRSELYQTVHRYIQEAFPRIHPYICMEPEHLWEQSFGRPAPTTEELTTQLDHAAR